MTDDETSSLKNNSREFDDILPNTVAFVLCHPNDSSFVPISKELPPCLFPLCNIPVLFYVLQWLNNNGIQKTYIICQESDKNPIQKLITECQKRLNWKSIEILVPEKSYSINSFTDSIKWIYSSSSIPLDFKNCIIVPGTVVTNVPIKNIIKEKSKKQILTTIFTKSTSNNGYSAVLDKEGFLLQLSIPPSFNFENQQASLEKRDENVVKNNLNDSLIYIVTPQFMSIFSSNNNIGCNSIMNDCVPSLIDHEKDKKSVRGFIFPDSYSFDIQNIQNYIDSSNLVINKKILPFSIESNLLAPSQTYTHLYDDDNEEEEEKETNNQSTALSETTAYHLQNSYVYTDNDVSIGSNDKTDHCVFGRGTTIDNGCLIQNSTIGNDCKIGKNVIIKNSIIWDRVIIEDGAQINYSVIASDCTIKKDVKIDFGSIISFNVVVDINLEPCRRLVGYECDGSDEKEIQFKEDDSPNWLIRYINERKPLKQSDEINYVEYIPSPESEVHLLNLWYYISPSTFPIDITKIGKEDEKSEEEENEEEESELFYEKPWGKN